MPCDLRRGPGRPCVVPSMRESLALSPAGSAVVFGRMRDHGLLNREPGATDPLSCVLVRAIERGPQVGLAGVETLETRARRRLCLGVVPVGGRAELVERGAALGLEAGNRGL